MNVFYSFKLQFINKFIQKLIVSLSKKYSVISSLQENTITLGFIID